MTPQESPRSQYKIPTLNDTAKGIIALTLGVLLVLYVFGLTPVFMGYLLGFLGAGLIIYGGMLLKLDKKIKQLIRRS